MEWTHLCHFEEMMVMSLELPSHRYSFESDNSRREGKRALLFLAEFKQRRLRLLDDDLDGQLLEFATHVHVNIEWYVRSIHSERWRKWAFFLLTAGIVAFLPFAMAHPDWGFVPSGEDATTRTTMVLTAFIGFYNSFRTWLQHHSGMGRFHEASSKLKELLYSFEGEWMQGRPLRLGGEERERFLKQLTRIAAEAKQIVREETRLHFAQATTLPDINPWTILTAARGSAKTISDEFVPKPGAAEISRTELESTIREKELLIRELDALAVDLEIELKSATAARQVQIKEAIKSVGTKQLATRQELAAARASLAAKP